jgi:hypothetical protein
VQLARVCVCVHYAQDGVNVSAVYGAGCLLTYTSFVGQGKDAGVLLQDLVLRVCPVNSCLAGLLGVLHM